MIGQKGSLLSVEIVAVAMAAIRANALRSVLTTLGIIIGVAAVITMVSLGEGAQQQIQAQIEGMGTNILSISAARGRGMGGVASGSARLYVDDAYALRDNSGGLLKVAPESSSRLQVTYLRWNDNLEVLGTWPEYFEMNNMELAHGRLFDVGEDQGRRRVAVSGCGGSREPGGGTPGASPGPEHSASGDHLRGHRGAEAEGDVLRLDEPGQPDLYPPGHGPVPCVRGKGLPGSRLRPGADRWRATTRGNPEVHGQSVRGDRSYPAERAPDSPREAMPTSKSGTSPTCSRPSKRRLRPSPSSLPASGR